MKSRLWRAALAVALYVAVLAVIYVVHARWLPVGVVFYSAMLDAALAVVVTAVLLAVVPVFRVLSGFERVQLVVICALLGYSFAISVPTVIDRSLSFYLLEKLDQRGGAIREDAFPGIFVHEYMPEFRLVDVRLTEQLESGTISIDGGCVRLTAKGEALARGSAWFRRTFLPRHRLLRGDYTSDLTTPLGRGAPSSDYRCGDG